MASPFDYVNPGNAPGAASYMAPNMAQQLYGMISGLPEDYFKGTQQARQRQLQNLFSGGLPTGPDGQPDIGAISQALSRTGGAEYTKELLPFLWKQQFLAGEDGGQQFQPQTSTGNQSSVREAPQPNIGGSVEGQRPDLIRGGGAPALPSYGIGQIRSMETVPDNSPPPVGAVGGAPLSPNPTGPGGGTPGNFVQRFAASQPQAPPGATPVQTVPAGGDPGAGMLPPGYRGDSRAFAAAAHQRAEALRAQARREGIAGIPSKALEDQAASLDARATKIDEAWAKQSELTPEEKNARNPSVLGFETAKTAGTESAKYFGSVYRGLTGSAFVAAQQKPNIAMLRQVAASPNFIPGPGSEAALWLQRAASNIPGFDPTRAAPREIFNQVATRVLADQFSGIKSMASETGEQGARIFKPMLDLEEKANVTHEDSLAGIKAKIDILDKSGDLMMRWGDMADDYAKQHGSLDPGFNKTLRSEIANARIGNVIPSSTPTAAHIEALRSHPERAQDFDAKFGPGVASRILGNR